MLYAKLCLFDRKDVYGSIKKVQEFCITNCLHFACSPGSYNKIYKKCSYVIPLDNYNWKYYLYITCFLCKIWAVNTA